MASSSAGSVVPDDEPDGALHTDTDQSTDWSEVDGTEDHSSEERIDLSR
jgi:hypothetical protein